MKSASEDTARNFSSFLQTNCGVSIDSKILLTVSGGMDSMCMLDLFHRFHFSILVLHCNFMLRGEESENDESFVLNYCKEKNIPVLSKKFSIEDYVKGNPGISTQMAARELRYQWFEKMRVQYSYDFIATAHHQNDVLETFLINFIKGTGIGGLHGIMPRKSQLIRPLLFLTKEEIIHYIQKHDVPYREDSSNSSDYYLRNKIRLHVIPELKKLNPNIEKTASENIKKIKDAERIFNIYIEEIIQSISENHQNGIRISISKLIALNSKFNDASLTFYYELFKKFGFNMSETRDIFHSLKGDPGVQFKSEEYILLKDRNYLFIEKITPEQQGIYHIHKGDKELKTPFFHLEVEEKKIFLSEIQKSPEFAYLNAAKLKYPLVLRTWAEGDFFHPSGMKKKKKISDFLIDKKISRLEKKNIWVMVSGNDIVWVLGHRVDEHYKLDESNANALVIKWSDCNKINMDETNN